MKHPIIRVQSFAIIGPYTILLTFSDGTEQRINFRPVLEGAMFGALKDIATFNAVVLDREAGTLVWPNGADFDPATLHEWPHMCEELAVRAERWTIANSSTLAG